MRASPASRASTSPSAARPPSPRRSSSRSPAQPDDQRSVAQLRRVDFVQRQQSHGQWRGHRRASRGSPATPATTARPCSRPSAPGSVSRWPTSPPSPRAPTAITRPPARGVRRGTVTLPALHTINTGTVVLESDRASGLLNVSALTGFTEADGWIPPRSRPPAAARSATVLSETSRASTLTIGGSSTIARRSSGHCTGKPDDQRRRQLAGLTSFNGSNITVSGGGTSSLTGSPATPATAAPHVRGDRRGNDFTLANLATVAESTSGYRATTSSRRFASGTVTLPTWRRSTPARWCSRATAAAACSTFRARRLHRGQRLDRVCSAAEQAAQFGDSASRPLGVDLRHQRLVRHRHGAATHRCAAARSPSRGLAGFAGLTSSSGQRSAPASGKALSLPRSPPTPATAVHPHAEATDAAGRLPPQPGRRHQRPRTTTARPARGPRPAGCHDAAGMRSVEHGTVVLESDGTGSQLIVPALTSFRVIPASSSIRRSSRPAGALSTIRAWPRSIRSISLATRAARSRLLRVSGCRSPAGRAPFRSELCWIRETWVFRARAR